MNTMDNKCRTMLEARDEQVFGQLEGLCGALCRRIARNILRSDEDAEEILNDTFFKVWSTIPPKKPDSVAAYAGRIARNLALNRYALAHTKRRDGGTLVDFDALLENPELFSGNAPADPTAECAEAKELSGAIADFLWRQSKTDRALFVRRYWHMDDADALCRDFNLTRNALDVRLHRIRGRLKKYLEGRDFL